METQTLIIASMLFDTRNMHYLIFNRVNLFLVKLHFITVSGSNIYKLIPLIHHFYLNVL